MGNQEEAMKCTRFQFVFNLNCLYIFFCSLSVSRHSYTGGKSFLSLQHTIHAKAAKFHTSSYKCYIVKTHLKLFKAFLFITCLCTLSQYLLFSLLAYFEYSCYMPNCVSQMIKPPFAHQRDWFVSLILGKEDSLDLIQLDHFSSHPAVNHKYLEIPGCYGWNVE